MSIESSVACAAPRRNCTVPKARYGRRFSAHEASNPENTAPLSKSASSPNFGMSAVGTSDCYSQANDESQTRRPLPCKARKLMSLTDYLRPVGYIKRACTTICNDAAHFSGSATVIASFFSHRELNWFACSGHGQFGYDPDVSGDPEMRNLASKMFLQFLRRYLRTWRNDYPSSPDADQSPPEELGSRAKMDRIDSELTI